MPDRLLLDRRTLLQTIAVTAGGGLSAGCSTNATTNDEQPSFDGWLENTDNYDGVVDKTDAKSVAVAVGAEGINAGFAFDPPALRITTGTTVRWEWTGIGGAHNVVATDGAFKSKLSDSATMTFQHRFESSGTYKYACKPHSSQGMKGVIVVQ
ncbi:halocyanin domain-containing protein [Halocatena halophila]|uniref:halocyanin domain-containing protein n=1 Tax=Halocatena halophila TaxID=2814576 RepID=UPI002ED44E36